MGCISLAVTLDSVAEVARRVLVLADETALGPERTYRLRLAAEEIATNIVVHGYGEADEPPRDDEFVLEWGCDADRVWICLRDGARPFDPTSAAPPDNLHTPLDERVEGGLGIHLVRDALDEFRYRRDDEHNEVVMAVRRTGNPAPAEK